MITLSFIFIIECDLFEWSKSVQVCYCLCISVLPLVIKLSRGELGSYCRGTWPWFPTTNVIFCCVYWTICGFVDTGGIVHHHCLNFLIMINEITLFLVSGGCRGRDRIVNGFTTTCATNAYHHWSCVFESRSWRGVLDATLCDKVCQWFVAGWWFSLGPPVSSNNKTDRHDITEILSKVVLNTITLTT